MHSIDVEESQEKNMGAPDRNNEKSRLFFLQSLMHLWASERVWQINNLSWSGGEGEREGVTPIVWAIEDVSLFGDRFSIVTEDFRVDFLKITEIFGVDF